MTQDMHEITQEQIVAFQMPQPEFGEPIAWHYAAARGRQELGFIIKVNPRNVSVRLANGRVHTSVRHIDDPKLLVNQEQAENGAWDFTEHDRKRAAERIEFLEEISSLRARVASLEDGPRAAEPRPKRTDPQAGANLKRRWALIHEARALGIEADVSSKTDWLEEQIAAKKAD